MIKSFLPWILFFLLAGNSNQSLETAIIAATIASIIFDLKYLKKGFVLSWGTTIFFTSIFFAVVILKNQSIAKYTPFLCNAALAVIAWISLLIKKPFTNQYAKETVPAEQWQHPLFIKINYILTSVWAMLFSVGTSLSLIQLYQPSFNSFFSQVTAWALPVFGVWFTSWFPDWYKAKYFKNLSGCVVIDLLE